MSVAVSDLLARLRDRAEGDPDLVEALAFLADDPDDPFAPVSPAVANAARMVSLRRQAERRDDLTRRSLSTREVVGLIHSITDRRAVDRRRHRGSLLGIPAGNTTLHPSWQFDLGRGETLPGLAGVLVALGEVTDEPRAADALMMASRPDLGGRSLADVLADGDVDLTTALIRAAGDQS